MTLYFYNGVLFYIFQVLSILAPYSSSSAFDIHKIYIIYESYADRWKLSELKKQN